jgi:signal peptidase I
MPGDVVEVRDECLLINGSRRAQHQLQVLPQIEARRNFDSVTIPKDQFLMLGDNRVDSADSCFIGLVPRELLIGRAERVLVSADMLGNRMPRTERFGMALAR